MEVKQKKTVRFDQLLKESGQPEQVTLWTAPEKDRDFMRAVKEDRVVTLVLPNVGTKKDYGLMGFFREKNAVFLVFPKPIRYPSETKIVGVKHDKIVEKSSKGPLYKPGEISRPAIPMREKSRRKEEATARTEEPREKAKKAKPLLRFEAKVELTARQSFVLETEAASVGEAKKRLDAQLAKLNLDPKSAKTTCRLRKVSQIK